MSTRIVYFLMGLLMAFTLVNCGKDDGNDPEPVNNETEDPAPVITVSDFSAAIVEDPSPGQPIGTITATTDKETLTFALSAQSHAGALVLNATTGELTVGDESHFVHKTNPQLTATAVVKAGVSEKTVAITVQVKRLPDIYFAGRTTDKFPAYWKNGEPVVLADNTYARAADIAVASNGDVYVAGYNYIDGYDVATLWKNGNEITLGREDVYSYALSVAISGSDVYVAGEIYDDESEIAIWKNGELLDLSYRDIEYFMTIEALAVIKNEQGQDELWGVGYTTNGEGAFASYIVIENITAGPPPYDADADLNPLEADYATDITVAGSDIYITMYERSATTGEFVAMYWKHGGDYINLGDGLTETRANGVATAGSNIYIAGYEQNDSRKTPLCWTNNTATPLPTPSSANAEAYSVAVFEGEVYVLGRILSGSSDPNSMAIWRNGRLFRTIPDATGYGLVLH